MTMTFRLLGAVIIYPSKILIRLHTEGWCQQVLGFYFAYGLHSIAVSA